MSNRKIIGTFLRRRPPWLWLEWLRDNDIDKLTMQCCSLYINYYQPTPAYGPHIATPDKLNPGLPLKCIIIICNLTSFVCQFVLTLSRNHDKLSLLLISTSWWYWGTWRFISKGRHIHNSQPIITMSVTCDDLVKLKEKHFPSPFSLALFTNIHQCSFKSWFPLGIAM